MKPKRKLTYDDLLEMPEDGKRREIIDGRLYVSPSPRPRHQVIALNLVVALKNHVDRQPDDRRGHLFIGPVDILLSPNDVVAPDLVYLAPERAGLLTELNIQGPPDLIVEILSPGNRRMDELRKWRLYERAGVGEYWIVNGLDAPHDVIKIFRQTSRNAFGPAVELSLAAQPAANTASSANTARDATVPAAAAPSSTLTTPLLPGLAVPLAAIFPPPAPAQSPRRPRS